MERTAWTDDESSSSWEDAEFDSLVGEERDEGANAMKAEDGAEQESFANDGDQGPAPISSSPACDDILEESLPVLRRRKPSAWKPVLRSPPSTGEPISPIGQESGVRRCGSPDGGSTLALALEGDAREESSQEEEKGAGFGNGSGGGVGEEEREEILEKFPGTAGDEIEVEESESQARGSLASFSFEGSPQPGAGSEASSMHGRIASLWPSGIESDEDEEVAPVRTRRLQLEVEVDQPPGIEEELASEQKRARPEGEVPEAEISEISEWPGSLYGEGIDDNESIGSSEICLVKEVYRMPETDYVPLANGDPQGQLLMWPAASIIQAIGFQLRLIGKAFSIFLWVLNLFCVMFWKPVEKTLEAKHLAAGTFNQGVSYVSKIPSGIRQTATSTVPKVGRLWKRMGLGCLAATYVLVMLVSLLVPAIIMDYAVMSRFVEEPIEVREVLNFDFTEPRPSAVVNLLPPAVMARAKTYASAHPDKLDRIRAIPMSHKFDATVTLTLPESDYNRRLGMFQISVELVSVRTHVLARSSRPCMLQFRSSPVRYAKTLLLGLPLLMGLSQEYQTLTVRVMENQEEMVVPTATVKAYLEPKTGFPEGHGLPELYTAEIRIKSKLPWMRALIYAWRWTFYVWTAFWIFMLEVTLILLCCRQALLPTSWRTWTVDSAAVHRSGYRSPRGRKASSGGGKKPCKVRRRVYFQDEIPTADVVQNLKGTFQAGGQGLGNALRTAGGGGPFEPVPVGLDKAILKTSAVGGNADDQSPS